MLVYFPSHKLLISGCGLNLWLINDDEITRFFKELDVKYFVGGLGGYVNKRVSGCAVEGYH